MFRAKDLTEMKILLLNSEFPPIGGGAGNASAKIVCDQGCCAEIFPNF
jgi:hypothetical protein